MKHKYHVVFYPVVGADPEFDQFCGTSKEARAVTAALINYTKLLQDNKLMLDSLNSVEVYRWTGCGWDTVTHKFVGPTEKEKDFHYLTEE